MENFKVILHSDEYGDDEFIYSTLEEARQGFANLVNDCRRASKVDSIEREINLVIESEFIDSEGN